MAFVDSVINQDEFLLINNVLREYKEIEKRNKKLKTWSSLSMILFYL